MEHILQHLERNVILNDEIILNIKNSIRSSYPSADEKYRARLLANSLHGKLDENLEGLQDDLRCEVRLSVFKNSIEENHLLVTQMDILSELTQADMQPKDLYSYMYEWFDTYTDTSLEYEQLHMVLSDLNPQLEPEDIFAYDTIEDVGVKNTSRLNTYPSLLKSALINLLNHSLERIKAKGYKLSIIFLALIFIIPVLFLTDGLLEHENKPHSISFVHASSILLYQPDITIEKELIVEEIFYREVPGYPEFLEFIELDYAKVVEYLHTRNSSFTDTSYLDVIYAVGEEYNVHPLLLLAIIGQEQGFVPKDSPYATRILNNPFNVYTSWTSYNTNLKDSCEVAAGTIRVILRERPVGENPFRWLNTRYAEDPNWWKGVQELFYTLLAHAE